MRDKSMTHATMVAQREAVLSAATTRLAARATDAQLNTLLQMAATGADPPPTMGNWTQPSAT